MQTTLRLSAFTILSLLFAFASTASSQWKQIVLPVTGGIYNVTALASSNGSVYVGGTAQGAQLLYKSIDNGNSWLSLDPGSPEPVVALAANGPNVYAILGDGGDTYNVYSSQNSGSLWNSISPPHPSVFTSSARSLAISANTLYVGTVGDLQGGCGVYASTDNGQSWFSTPAPNGNFGDTVGLGAGSNNVFALWGTADTVFAGTGNGLFKAGNTTSGGPFLAASSGLKDKHINAIAALSTDLFVGTTGGIFLSTDNGGTWEITNLPTFTAYSFATSGIDVVAGLGDDTGVVFSTDMGASWSFENAGLSAAALSAGGYALTISGNSVFMGAVGAGLWRRPLSELGVPQVAVSNTLELEQNYPNPSIGATTTIKYSHSSQARVMLSVYNMLGQIVARQITAVQSPGEYSVELNTSMFAPGAYVYRVQANGEVVQKMMMIER